jgi:hypothetical protein
VENALYIEGVFYTISAKKMSLQQTNRYVPIVMLWRKERENWDDESLSK